MSLVTEKAYAKVNFDLYVIRKREDGYHLISSLMQTISLFDELTIEPGEGITLTSEGEDIPTGPENTVYKAASLMIKTYGLAGLKVHVKKNIPIGAGLGGPSADAAALLRGANRLFNLNLNSDKLSELGLKVGADVPFLIDGGAALCEGVGDILAPVEANGSQCILLCKPKDSISTPWAYGRIDELSAFSKRADDSMIKAVEEGDAEKIGALLYNDFEKAVFDLYPNIKDIKQALKELGAINALMSGSGSTVFGIFDSKDSMENAKRAVEESMPGVQVIPTVTISKYRD